MERLVKALKELAELYPLDQHYEWDIPSGCPLVIPDDIKGLYHKNVYLKQHLSAFISLDKPIDNRYWIIQEWGGIRAFQQNKLNNTLLKNIDSELEKGELSKSSMTVISSLSKVASFLNHDQYAIYDSRAIYSLNWLLFKYTENKEFFIQPVGRNKVISRCQLATIFYLSGRQCHYKNYKYAYHEYCALLKALSKEIYGQPALYKLEMLLFMIAPDYIVSDIQKSLKLTIEK